MNGLAATQRSITTGAAGTSPASSGSSHSTIPGGVNSASSAAPAISARVHHRYANRSARAPGTGHRAPAPVSPSVWLSRARRSTTPARHARSSACRAPTPALMACRGRRRLLAHFTHRSVLVTLARLRAAARRSPDIQPISQLEMQQQHAIQRIHDHHATHSPRFARRAPLASTQIRVASSRRFRFTAMLRCRCRCASSLIESKYATASSIEHARSLATSSTFGYNTPNSYGIAIPPSARSSSASPRCPLTPGAPARRTPRPPRTPRSRSTAAPDPRTAP